MTEGTKVHIFSTDISVFELVDLLPKNVQITALVYPSNRQRSGKVLDLIAECERRGLPAFKHSVRKPLPAELPAADAGISWVYAQVILEEDFDRYSLGILNNHGGALPKYRGFHIPQWAIVEGEEELGVTWHGVTADVDGEPIWMESRIPIAPDMTAWDLRGDMIAEGVRMFPEAWQHFCNHDITPRLPNTPEGHWWPPRTPENGHIPPGQTRRKVHDVIRASCPPWPRAYVKVGADNVYVDAVVERAGDHTLSYESSDQGTIHLRLIMDNVT
jgi:methionyl-tRNA formyltransferase